MNQIVSSVQAEYLRYKGLAEGAIAQLSDADLVVPGPGDGNSIAVLCWHLAGNFRSRFTDFLASDGEKPWRRREEEFSRRAVTKDEPPDGASVIGTLNKLNQIAHQNMPPTGPALEWDEQEQVVVVTDPYLLYYLRWSTFLEKEAEAET